MTGVVAAAAVLLALIGCCGPAVSTLTVENSTPYQVEIVGGEIRGVQPWIVESSCTGHRPIHIPGWYYTCDAAFRATPMITGQAESRQWDITLTRPGPYVLRVYMDGDSPAFVRLENDTELHPDSNRISVRRDVTKPTLTDPARTLHEHEAP